MNAISIEARQSAPSWALRQRRLLNESGRAAEFFFHRYTRGDGSLVWRDEWPGMDGSDDAYESWFNFPLLTALGGSPHADRLARLGWEGVTRQFTAYGQVWREFDGYYDWMHHGESSLLFYYFALADPGELRMLGRARRFAEMYTGQDPLAPNYDTARRLIRSPINGSRGPRFVNTAEDWVTHRPILANYPPPFDDVPGIPKGSKTADWNDDATFDAILGLMNERMMQGDVPLNLTATSLATHAFMLTGDDAYRAWALDYVQAWIERADANGGLLPDNVGPSGEIGEMMGGKWWGGYYGWRWPHGYMNLIQSALIGASNALLLSGDPSYLKLPRQLLDTMLSLGKSVDGAIHIPHRHGDGGWHDFRPAEPGYAIRLWSVSAEEEDAERVGQWWNGANPTRIEEGRGKGDDIHLAPWFAFVTGKNPDYPDAILACNEREAARRLDLIREDDGDPESWDVHHWQDRNPVTLEGTVQLTMGGPNALYHGGLLHSRVRWFDEETRRPGLPPDVAACVTRVSGGDLEIEVANLSALHSRTAILQAGAFGEHRFTEARVGDHRVALNGSIARIRIEPSSGARLTIGMELYRNRPSYGRVPPGA